MAKFYLITAVVLGTVTRWPGELVDDAIESTTPFTNAGALLWPSTDAAVASAATRVAEARKRGANIEFCQAIMADGVRSLNKDELFGGARVANVADDNVIGGLEVVHVIDIADGATADKDVVLTHKTEITHIEVIKKAAAGGASDTLTVKNGATAITNAMDINVADKTVVRPTTIDDAQTVIAAGGTLRVTKTKASGANVACRVIVRGVRRA